MTQSDRLRQTAAGFGGGAGTYNRKARLLGWKLKFNIEHGMQRTIKSYYQIK